jgi:hypothetical protein
MSNFITVRRTFGSCNELDPHWNHEHCAEKQNEWNIGEGTLYRLHVCDCECHDEATALGALMHAKANGCACGAGRDAPDCLCDGASDE